MVKSVNFLGIYLFLLVAIYNCEEAKDSDFTDRYGNISHLIEPGDIILRRGNSLLSNMILMESPEEIGLTHVGIVSFDSTVIDIVGDSLHPHVRKDSLENFVKNAVPGTICITRLRSNLLNREKVALEAEIFLKEKISFDYDFNTLDRTELYCSELVWIALHKASENLKFPTIIHYRDKKIIGLQTFLNRKYFSAIYSEKECP